MQYAQSPECRMQILRAYFGEDAADPCGRCDNCRVTETSNRHMQQRAAAPGLHPRAAPSREPAPQTGNS
jgi:ATP-dependent DNA helicase RecQ